MKITSPSRASPRLRASSPHMNSPLVSKVLSFRLKKQTSHTVADTTFKWILSERWWIVLQNGWPTALTPCFLTRPLSEIITIADLRHAASWIWTCAEAEFRLCWMKLCSTDHHYTKAATRVAGNSKPTGQIESFRTSRSLSLGEQSGRTHSPKKKLFAETN